MTDEKHEPDEELEEPEDPTLLPNREVMSLISPRMGGLEGIVPIPAPDATLPPSTE